MTDNIHPFQDQVSKMWDFIQKRSRAITNEHWIEALSLTYTLYEMNLRVLLSSKVGDRKITPEQIKNQKNLINLANLARDNGFIDQTIWDRIQKFNDGRIDTIHYLAQGKIEYEQIREVLRKASRLFYDIQNCWMPITFGEIETFEQYKK